MALRDLLKRVRLGRPRHEPTRETVPYPELMKQGQIVGTRRMAVKPTPRNLRNFSRSVYGRAAINAIKDPVAELEWEVVPLPGVDLNSELERQIEIATTCFAHPNNDDSFRTLVEQVVNDMLISAGAIELQQGGDAVRPLWLYPVDGLSIQINPAWAGGDDARYVQVPGYGTYTGSGSLQVPLRNDELIYLRQNPATDTPFGLGPLEVAFTSISRLLGVGEFAGNVASNQRPSIGLDLGNDVSPETVAAFRSFWRDEVEGQGQMPVFGLKNITGDKDRGPSVLRLFPEGDAGLMLEWQNFLKTEIAVAFGLSPMNLGVERDVNRTTAEVGQDRDRDRAIKPIARNIEQHLTREALHGKLGFYGLMFRFKGLDPEDAKSLAEVYQLEYKNNAITPAEYREARGRPPSDNAYADMTFADTQIAIQAARASMVIDPDLDDFPTRTPPAAPAAPAKKG